MGAAILDYLSKGKAGKLSILSSMFEEDEMPVKPLSNDSSSSGGRRKS